MTQRMQELATEIVRLQSELDREIETRRKVLGWRLREGMVEFERGIAIEHRRLRMGVATFLARSPLGTILSAPVIYSVIVPLLLLDIWASFYQAICFRVYRIPQVILPAGPVCCRATPHEALPCFKKPVSSMTRTASGSLSVSNA
jgi:hypothetical protein